MKEAYNDPTTDDLRWFVVDLAPVEALKKPVTLEQIKADEQLANITKLAVQKVTEQEISSSPLTKNDLRAILFTAMEGKSDAEKKDFITKVADIVLANLEPFGRSHQPPGTGASAK